MLYRVRNAFLIVLLFLACQAGIAWIHSYRVGYRDSWANAHHRACGRFVSSRGQIIRQTFSADVRPLTVNEIVPEKPIRLPENFVVGSNPHGNRTEITVGSILVPFGSPSEGMFIGLSTAMQGTGDPETNTILTFRGDEQVIAYWFLLLLLLLIPVVAGLEWLWRRVRPTAEPDPNA